jgi:hypothetical protein
MFLNSPKNSSAGGQEEHPCEVNSSTTAFSCALATSIGNADKAVPTTKPKTDFCIAFLAICRTFSALASLTAVGQSRFCECGFRLGKLFRD